jgi:hypothetical protein
MNESDFRDVAALMCMWALINQCGVDDEDNCAMLAYRQADAMVRARNKEPEQESGIAAFKPKRRVAKKVSDVG